VLILLVAHWVDLCISFQKSCLIQKNENISSGKPIGPFRHTQWIVGKFNVEVCSGFNCVQSGC